MRIASGVAVRGAFSSAILEWQKPVLDKDLTAPPGSPGVEDRYIVASVATGAWATHEDDIAEWNGTAWIFSTPAAGWAVYIADESEAYFFDGTNWNQESFGPHAVTHITGSDQLPHTYVGDILQRNATVWEGIQIAASEVDYLVGPAGSARFQTIQSAIDQAVTDGHDHSNPAMIYILGGTYTENLNLKPGISLAAVLPQLPAREGLPIVGVTVQGSMTFNLADAGATQHALTIYNIGVEPTTGVTLVLQGTARKVITFKGCVLTSADDNLLDLSAHAAPFETIQLYKCKCTAYAGFIATLQSGQTFTALSSALNGKPDGQAFKLDGGWLSVSCETPETDGIGGQIEVVSGSTGNKLYLFDTTIRIFTLVYEVVLDGALDTAQPMWHSFFDSWREDKQPLRIGGANSAQFVEVPSTASAGDIWKYNGQQWEAIPDVVENEISTTDATQTTIATIPIPDDTAVFIQADIAARATNLAGRAAYIRRVLVYREAAGAPVFQGTINTEFTRESLTLWDATFVISGNNVLIQVKGRVGDNVNWNCRHTAQERS